MRAKTPTHAPLAGEQSTHTCLRSDGNVSLGTERSLMGMPIMAGSFGDDQ